MLFLDVDKQGDTLKQGEVSNMMFHVQQTWSVLMRSQTPFNKFLFSAICRIIESTFCTIELWQLFFFVSTYKTLSNQTTMKLEWATWFIFHCCFFYDLVQAFNPNILVNQDKDSYITSSLSPVVFQTVVTTIQN